MFQCSYIYDWLISFNLLNAMSITGETINNVVFSLINLEILQLRRINSHIAQLIES